MDNAKDRSKVLRDPDGAEKLPVAYLVCNGSPPVDGKPSLLTFRDVETLFHEAGHGLQHGKLFYGNTVFFVVWLPSHLLTSFVCLSALLCLQF